MRTYMLGIVKMCYYMENKLVNFRFRLRESNPCLIENQFGLRDTNMQRHKYPSTIDEQKRKNKWSFALCLRYKIFISMVPITPSP